ncbi:MAG: amidohydrolase family protein, partial [Candidatus Aminicenantes bacterium]
MKNKSLFILSIAAAAATVMFFPGCAPQEEETADLVLMNGKILTLDTGRLEANALAALDGKIIAAGDHNTIQAYIGENTQVIDLEGHLAVPGLTDSHAHFMSIGQAKLGLDLVNVKNWQEIVDMVEKAAENADPGEWIIGRGWHQEKWDAIP